MSIADTKKTAEQKMSRSVETLRNAREDYANTLPTRPGTGLARVAYQYVDQKPTFESSLTLEDCSAFARESGGCRPTRLLVKRPAPTTE